MIRVRMGEKNPGKPPDSTGLQHRLQNILSAAALGCAPAVRENAPAARKFNQDAVALSHIEHRDPQLPRRICMQEKAEKENHRKRCRRDGDLPSEDRLLPRIRPVFPLAAHCRAAREENKSRGQSKHRDHPPGRRPAGGPGRAREPSAEAAERPVVHQDSVGDSPENPCHPCESQASRHRTPCRASQKPPRKRQDELIEEQSIGRIFVKEPERERKNRLLHRQHGEQAAVSAASAEEPGLPALGEHTHPEDRGIGEQEGSRRRLQRTGQRGSNRRRAAGCRAVIDSPAGRGG